MAGQTITLRLTIQNPVPGVAYSLQDKANAPVKARVASDSPLRFDAPITLTDNNRFTGPFVRREGPTRRFVYICIGAFGGPARQRMEPPRQDRHSRHPRRLAGSGA